jgi:hypothetical protein
MLPSRGIVKKLPNFLASEVRTYRKKLDIDKKKLLSESRYTTSSL